MTRNTVSAALKATAQSLILLTASLPGSAQGIQVTVDGQPVSFTGARPMEIRGRTMVPLRGVLEQLGATVVWDGATRTVTGSRENHQFQLPIGAATAIVDGQTVPLDVPAQIVIGNTMVPLRFVSQALGADVAWNGAARTVAITTSASYTAAGGIGPRPRVGGAGTGGRRAAAAATPEILSFLSSTQGPVRAGGGVQVSMQGTHAAKATFDIVGVARNLPMTEQRPGQYVGRYTVPPGITVRNARVLGHLAVDGQEAPPIQAGTPLTIDAEPPQIVDFSPAPNSLMGQTHPDIYAEYRAQGDTRIDPASVRMTVNGRDVTSEAKVTPGFIFFNPTRGMSGPVDVRLRVADTAGNVQTAARQFVVRPSVEGLKSVSVAPQQALAPGATLTVTAQASPGGRAAFDLPGIATGVGMTETSPAVYTGSYTVRALDKAYQIPVRVRFVAPDGQASALDAARPVTLAGGRLLRPAIMQPVEGTRLGDSFSIVGRADPGATVRLTISATGKLFGIVAIDGGQQVKEARASADGLFSTPPITVSVPLGARDVKIRIDARTVDPLGRASPATTVEFAR